MSINNVTKLYDAILIENSVSSEGKCHWFDPSEIPALPMPFTARYVMEHYLSIGQKEGKVYGGIADGKTVVFTELKAF